MTRFLSWPGAKFRQMESLMKVLPRKNYSLVVEPFFGTGAFTWEMISQHPMPHRHFIAAEKDRRLAHWWECILHRTDDMIAEMASVRDEFSKAGEDRDEFDRLRGMYNSLQDLHAFDLRTSAMLWVLIYQSTNNLARFNSSGGYNQTWGKGRKVPDPKVIFDADSRNMLETFREGHSHPYLISDFRDVIYGVDHYIHNGGKPENCIVYLDPPYIVRTETYQRGVWVLDDENKMWEWCREMDELAIPWIMTNYLRKDDTVSGKIVEHPHIEEIEKNWKCVPLDRKLDARPKGTGTMAEEVIILGRCLEA